MTREQILAWLPLIGSKPAADQSRGGWVVASCPLRWRHGGEDKNPSFGVKIEGGDGFTNCFSCGWHGSQAALVVEITALHRKDPYGPLQLGQALKLIDEAEDGLDLNLDSPDIEQVLFGGAKPKPHPYPEAWLTTFPHAWSSAAGRSYLEGRDVGAKVAAHLDLRFDGTQGRVCFPVRDGAGTLRGLHGRALQPDVEPRYRMYPHQHRTNPQFWLGEHWVDLEQPILVVEGPFDLASVLRVYPNAVSPLFANPSFDKLRRMVDALEWITLLDNGTGGNKGRARISECCTRNVVTHLYPPVGKDPGSCTLDEIGSLLAPHVCIDTSLLD